MLPRREVRRLREILMRRIYTQGFWWRIAAAVPVKMIRIRRVARVSGGKNREKGGKHDKKRKGLNWSSSLDLQVKRLLPLILVLVRKKMRVEMMTVLGIMKQWRIDSEQRIRGN